MAFLNIKRWPALLVFLLAGTTAAVFAFVTASLFTEAMASLRLLREFGGLAIQHGALVQVAQLLLWGCLSLACWLVFKICEHDLEDRYFAWAGRRQKDRSAQSDHRSPKP